MTFDDVPKDVADSDQADYQANEYVTDVCPLPESSTRLRLIAGTGTAELQSQAYLGCR